MNCFIACMLAQRHDASITIPTGPLYNSKTRVLDMATKHATYRVFCYGLALHGALPPSVYVCRSHGLAFTLVEVLHQEVASRLRR